MEIAERKTCKLNIIGDKLSFFFYGKLFPVYLGLIVSICYLTKTPLVSLAIFSLLASFVFIFYKDASPIIPLLFNVVLAFRDYNVMNEFVPYILLSPAIVTFIARFFIHPIKLQKPGKLTIPLILVTFAFSYAGILRAEYDFIFGIAFTISLGPTMLLIYLFFYYNIRPVKDFNLKEYLCCTLVATGITIILHIIYNRLSCPFGEWYELGWANVNAAAAFLYLSIPACYYLLTKSNNIIPWYIVILVLYAGVSVSGSDATFGIVITFTPFMLFFAYRNILRKNKFAFAFLTTLTISIVAIACIVLVSILGAEKTLEYLNISFSDSGRNTLYEKALRLFKENPIFGYGLNYVDDRYTVTPLRLYNFHSVLFHVLATMGIFGLLVYIFYIGVRFFIVMKNHTPFTMFMTVALIMFECFAMVDTCEFNAIPVMSTITVIVVVTELVTKKGNAFTALPLAVNKRRGFVF